MVGSSVELTTIDARWGLGQDEGGLRIDSVSASFVHPFYRAPKKKDASLMTLVRLVMKNICIDPEYLVRNPRN